MREILKKNHQTNQTNTKPPSYLDSAYSHNFTKHTQFDMQSALLEDRHALPCFPLFKSHCQVQVPLHLHLILCAACLSHLHHFSSSPWYREHLCYLNFLEKNKPGPSVIFYVQSKNVSRKLHRKRALKKFTCFPAFR